MSNGFFFFFCRCSRLAKGAEKSGKENGAEADEKELDVEVAIEVKGMPSNS